MTQSRDNGIEQPLRGSDLFEAVAFERTVVAVIAVLLAVRTAYLISAAWSFTTDDAYITLRYARHLVEGHGITWNVGEPPVEGYSNFVFVILGAAAIALKADPILIFKILSCLALVVTCVLLYRLARPWAGRIGATLPPIFLTYYEGTVLWAVSGLETAVYQMVVVAAVAAFYKAFEFGRRSSIPASSNDLWSGGWLIVTGMLVALAGLVRPEGPLIGIALGIGFVVDVALRAARARGVGDPEVLRGILSRGAVMGTKLALSFIVPYGLYFLWRYSHFGRIWPNSVYCKAFYAGDPLVLIKGFWSMAWPGFCFAMAAPLVLRRRLDVRVLVLLLGVLLYLVTLYGVDPIVSQLNRYFLTAYALLLVPAAIGLVGLVGYALPRVPKHVREFAVTLCVLVYTSVTVTNQHAVLWGRAYEYRLRMAGREQLGQWLDHHLSPEDSFVIGDTGIAAYSTRANVLDAFCLNSAEMTRPPIDHSPTRFVDFVFEKRPDMIVIHSKSQDRLDPRTELGIFPLFVARDELTTDYHLTHTAGAVGFYYWVFERNHR